MKRNCFRREAGSRCAAEKNLFHNESLADLVTNVTAKQRLAEYKGYIIQEIDPGFPGAICGKPDQLQNSFFFPDKNLFGVRVSTFVFDLLVVWSMSVV